MVRKLFLQSPVLGFEDNFAFHFYEEGGASLHDICLFPIDYHTLSSLFCAQIKGQLRPALLKCNSIYFSGGILGDQCQCFHFTLEANFK